MQYSRLHSGLLLVLLLSSCSTTQDPDTKHNATIRYVTYHVEQMYQACPPKGSVVDKDAADLKYDQKIASLEEQINELQNQMNQPRKLNGVAFHVALGKTQTSTGIVRFDKVLQNYGNGWDPKSHSFYAPVSGLYWFQLNIMNPTNKGMGAVAYIQKGDKILQRAWADSHGWHNVGIATAVVDLKRDDRITAHLSGGVLHSNSDHWTIFVGFLIEEM